MAYLLGDLRLDGDIGRSGTVARLPKGSRHVPLHPYLAIGSSHWACINRDFGPLASIMA
jgi:hypothetical protein